MSNIERMMSATIVGSEFEHREKQMQFANPDSYSATSTASTKMIYAEYDGTATIFDLEESLPDGRTRYASSDRKVYELCRDAAWERCALGFDGKGDLKLVELGDVRLSLSKRVSLSAWILTALVACVVLGIVLMISILH